MVGRFESNELCKEALAHEELCARQGLWGRCWCLLGTALTIMGLFGWLGGLNTLLVGGSDGIRAAPIGSVPSVRLDLEPSFALEDEAASSLLSARSGRSLLVSDGSRDPLYGSTTRLGIELEYRGGLQHEPLGMDLSLLTVLVAVVVVCIVPMVLRGNPWPWSNDGSAALLGMPGPGGEQLAAMPTVGSMAGAAFEPRWGQASAMDWASTPGSTWQPPVMSGGAFGSTTWLRTGPPAASATTPWGGPPRGLSVLLPGLPSEAEVLDSYNTFGSFLQRWAPALAQVVETQIIGPCLHELEQSDLLWQQALATRGWRLSFEPPQFHYPGLGGSSPGALSIFERVLPGPLCDDPRAPTLWRNRQVLEGYLLHPGFDASQRRHVLERLREWRLRGLASAMRYTWRDADHLPTDLHILENLIMKMLDIHMEFTTCFVTATQAPPFAKHLGETPTVYLRQVMDQNAIPKPAPHYEVFTPMKVWKLRPGNTNLLEALAIMVHILRQQNPRSHQAFPLAIRSAVEPTLAQNIPGRLLPWLFGR